MTSACNFISLGKLLDKSVKKKKKKKKKNRRKEKRKITDHLIEQKDITGEASYILFTKIYQRQLCLFPNIFRQNLLSLPHDIQTCDIYFARRIKGVRF